MSYSNIFELTKRLTSHKVFVDTCSFMHTEAHVFFSRLIPELEYRHAQINIPLSVTAEIVQNTAVDRPVQCRANATEAYKIVNNLIANKLARQIANNSNKTFADHVFEIFLESERMDSNILLITQDKALAKRAVLCNLDNAVRGKRIEIMKINASGGASFWNVDGLLEEIQCDIQKSRMKGRTPHLNETVRRPYRPTVHQVPGHIQTPVYQELSYNQAPIYPRVTRPQTRVQRNSASVNGCIPDRSAMRPKKQKSQSESVETCIDCGARFTVSVGEARALMAKGFNFPKRCPACRHARKINGNAKLSYC